MENEMANKRRILAGVAPPAGGRSTHILPSEACFSFACCCAASPHRAGSSTAVLVVCRSFSTGDAQPHPAEPPEHGLCCEASKHTKDSTVVMRFRCRPFGMSGVCRARRLGPWPVVGIEQGQLELGGRRRRRDGRSPARGRPGHAAAGAFQRPRHRSLLAATSPHVRSSRRPILVARGGQRQRGRCG